ncbi:hypothetical protein EPO04_02145 [Patescibacteria group bacterium]|nr:MAG: hypothetical protein EPO04_02145 [Patescibacteria group bacterium]
MPKTKTNHHPDHPVSEVYFPLKPRMKLGRRTASWLMATFALVGVVTIWTSAAATKPLVTLQAEQMKPDRSSVFAFYDQRAVGKAATVMFGNSTITTTNVQLSQEAQEVTIRARSQRCLGSPQLQLKVDNKAVGMATVSASGYSEYRIATKIPAGTHTIGASFINDYYNWGRHCDRNLIIDQIEIRGASLVSSIPTPPVIIAPHDTDKDGVADTTDGCDTQPGPATNQGCPLQQTGVQAKTAGSFIDSIGVNTHIGYGSYPYNDIQKVKDGLQKLGIRNVRDGDYLNNPTGQARLKTLFDAGIKTDLLTNSDDLVATLNNIKSYPQGKVAALEGINEPDCFLKDKRSDWVEFTRNYQKDFWNRVKNDATLQNADILSPAYCRAETAATVGDLSPYFEYSAIHPYPGGWAPEKAIADQLKLSASASGGKPFYATETGYHNAIYTQSGHNPATQRASGIYMPRLFLSYYLAGIKRTYSYELVDQRPANTWNLIFDHEGNFGMLNYNFSEKPAGAAIRRLTTLLGDTNTNFQPGKLDYSVSGDTSNLQQLLVQRPNGTFYLVLWRTDSVWDVPTRRDLPIVNKPLTVKVGNEARNVKVYNINTGDAPTITAKVAQLQLNLGPEVQILEIQ